MQTSRAMKKILLCKTGIRKKKTDLHKFYLSIAVLFAWIVALAEKIEKEQLKAM